MNRTAEPAIEDIDADKYEFGARSRPLGARTTLAVYWLCAAYTAFHLAVLNFVPLDEWLFRLFHVTGAQVIAFLFYCVWRGERRDTVPVWDWLLIAASVWCAYYIPSEYPDIIGRTGVVPTTLDGYTGLIGTALVLEVTRRTAGPVLPALAAIFIIYVFVGPVMPGVLHHGGQTAQDFFSFVYSMEGVFGPTTAASSQFIVLFVCFAAFLQVSGVGDYFMKLSIALFGWARGGPAKVAVISGILFGAISGSAVANVVASGTFTIPTMRRVGYSRNSAAAIEATSSTGGQITPPVMGAGAFIMAELTGIPYTDIALAALLPAILFYVANYAHVDIEAIKQNIRGLPRSELPEIGPLLTQICMLTPLAVLILLLLSGYSVIAAGTWGTAATVLVCLLNHVRRVHTAFLLIPVVALWLLLARDWNPNEAGSVAMGGALVGIVLASLVLNGLGATRDAVVQTLRDLVAGLVDSTKQSLQLVAVCACAGIIVGVLGLTGLGGRFAAVILAIAGTSQLLALFFGMFIALVLGMGMPTTAAYMIAAAVVAPGLQQIGVPPLIAHLFVFYYAVVSAITPPVALASFAAAALAKADPWKTSFESMRYGIATFIVPFMFYYQPEILMQGSTWAVLQVAATACLGIWLLAIASEAWLRGQLNLVERLFVLAAVVLLCAGGALMDVIGIAMAIAFYAWRRIRSPGAALSA